MGRHSGLSTSPSDREPPADETEVAFVLSEALALKVAAHCAATGDTPRDFIADAILLALDADDVVFVGNDELGDGRAE